MKIKGTISRLSALLLACVTFEAWAVDAVILLEALKDGKLINVTACKAGASP
ncbi:hypothetical protein SAMN05518865_114185 [Duganella sp. CF458]|uniref:hypothetical protein n=1 Tax=Duganella sp. CF458 TaxID=1884368 RepID=UPI0008EE2689|nr:hypothetical protein [Duganella sp. CF458]SFG61234.1 hypothetical protein SAMN05518865_114185 [Duganella sp. CF458]